MRPKDLVDAKGTSTAEVNDKRGNLLAKKGTVCVSKLVKQNSLKSEERGVIIKMVDRPMFCIIIPKFS